jgi:putative hemolysin
MRLSNAPAIGRAPDLESQRFAVSVATSAGEVKEAQRLRHRVFVQEMGANLRSGAASVERDRFDPFCKHLIVRDRITSRIVGTYRILTPERAAALGGFMAEREFDLAPLAVLRQRMIEVGRACIDADYRCGSIIMLLWSGLAAYAQARGLGFLFGCVSIGLGDAQFDARAVYGKIETRFLAPPEYRVLPRTELPKVAVSPNGPAVIPPLLKGYLRAGAWVCGEPAWDPEFGTADLPVLLQLDRVESRYARHFLHAPAVQD